MKPYVASHLKDMNRKNVYKLMRGMESTSKAEIAKLTGISAPTVIKIVHFLMEKNLVVELGAGETPLGRKPQLIALNRDIMYVASFILEGDFLNAGIVDIVGNVIYKISLLVKQDIISCLREITDHLVNKLFQEARIPLDKLCGIGVALPGIYNKETMTVSSPLVTQQEELCLQEEIAALSQKYQVEVYVENDANAQALGEFEIQSLTEQEDLIFISLGTGLGAGVILGGKLRRGVQNMCGEIGYISYDSSYRSDKREWGWLEASIGYRKLEEKFQVMVTSQDVKCTPQCRQEIIAYVADYLARCINNISVLLDCGNVVVGGKIIEFLGKDLINKINEALSYLCVTGVKARIQSTVDVGMVGIASLVTKKEMEALLMEELD